jgi:hypothetical protein
MGQKMYVRGTAADPEFKIVDAVTWLNPPPVIAVDVVRIVRASNSSPRPLSLLRPTPPSSPGNPPATSTSGSTSSAPARSVFGGHGK